MSMPDFTEEQVLRYSRHIILPGIGGEGQRKLLDAKVLCVGAGGLGSPIAMYLAAAGVGKIGIVDFDRSGTHQPPTPNPARHRRTWAGRRRNPPGAPCNGSIRRWK